MTERHVVAVDDGWQVEKKDAQRPSARTTTQADAITRAAEIVAKAGGGHIVIHDEDGRTRETRPVTAAHGPSPDNPSAEEPASGSPVGSDHHNRHDRGHHDMTPQRGHAHRAARKAARRNAVRVNLPVIGSVELPPSDQLAYLGGITGLVAIGVLEWPVAAILGAGHLLASARNHKLLADFGAALEEA